MAFVQKFVLLVMFSKPIYISHEAHSTLNSWMLPITILFTSYLSLSCSGQRWLSSEHIHYDLASKLDLMCYCTQKRNDGEQAQTHYHESKVSYRPFYIKIIRIDGSLMDDAVQTWRCALVARWRTNEIVCKHIIEASSKFTSLCGTHYHCQRAEVDMSGSRQLDAVVYHIFLSIIVHAQV